MTNVNDTLDPIRPDDCTVGDNMPSVVVERCGLRRRSLEIVVLRMLRKTRMPKKR